VTNETRASIEEVVADAREHRRYGVVRGGASDASVPADAARAFGLEPDAATHEVVDAAQARALLSSLLRVDLAYLVELMERERADRLAADFVDRVGPDATFFTNGNDPTAPVSKGYPCATSATLDAGILAVTATGSACLWVEDED